MATAKDSVSNSSLDEKEYTEDGFKSNSLISNGSGSDISGSACENNSLANERLQGRLHEDSGLRYRRGKGLNEPFEFASSNKDVLPSEAPTTSAIIESITNDSTSMYQQRPMFSSDEGSSTTKDGAVKNDDSGGAKPKIKEKDPTSNNNSSSNLGSSNTERLGSTEDIKSQSKNDTTEDSNSNAAFECNICLDVARDAVISMCGHLFCWPCLHTWLETRPNRQICPVCKAGIGKDKVVPLYGRDDANPKDPREKPVPPRPKGQRPEPESTGGSTFGGFGGFGGGGGNGFQMSFGIGAFPFGFFATNFNLGDAGHTHVHGMRGHGTGGAPEGSAQFEEEQFLHKVFLWVAFLFIFWLLVA